MRTEPRPTVAGAALPAAFLALTLGASAQGRGAPPTPAPQAPPGPSFELPTRGSADAPDPGAIAVHAGFGVARIEPRSPEGARPFVRAAGPGYKADFAPGGFTFQPARGDEATEALPFRFELTDVGRASGERRRGARSMPRVEEHRVVVDHGDGLVEVYDVFAEGLEQSFVLDAPPSGAGDLVVRGTIETALTARPAADGSSIAFESPDGAGVRWSDVVGIDARGERASGTLRLDGDMLELVLPESFVDRASYPLVLDPMITPLFGVSGNAIVRHPQVAYDAGVGSYLVVWQHSWTAFDTDIHAQRVSPSGELVGDLIFVEPDEPYLGTYPSVTNIRGTTQFVVAWNERFGGFGADMHVTFRNLSFVLVTSLGGFHEVTAGALPGTHFSPHLASGSGPTDNYALLVWDSSDEGIVALRIDPQVFGGFTYSIADREVVTAGYDPDDMGAPSLSRHGGDDGRFAVVWKRLFQDSSTDHDVYIRLYDSALTPLTSPTSVLTSIGPDEQNPDVDGDGSRFVVVYESAPALFGFDIGIHARMFRFNELGWFELEAETVVLDDDSLYELKPQVAHAPGKWFVAMTQEYASSVYDLYVAELDAETLAPCGPLTLTYTDNEMGEPALAAQVAGGAPDEEDGLLCVWQDQDTFDSTQNQIQAKVFQSWGFGGPASFLGGGCGGGGTIATVGVSAIGYPDFAIEAQGVAPGATVAILNLSAPGLPTLACGSCVLNTYQFLFPAPVFAGTARVPLPIPCNPNLAGKQVDAQFTVGLTASSPCPLIGEVSFSDRMRVEFGF